MSGVQGRAAKEPWLSWCQEVGVCLGSCVCTLVGKLGSASLVGGPAQLHKPERPQMYQVFPVFDSISLLKRTSLMPLLGLHGPGKLLVSLLSQPLMVFFAPIHIGVGCSASVNCHCWMEVSGAVTNYTS